MTAPNEKSSLARQMDEAGLLPQRGAVKPERKPDNTAPEWWNRPLERMVFAMFIAVMLILGILAYKIL